MPKARTQTRHVPPPPRPTGSIRITQLEQKVADLQQDRRTDRRARDNFARRLWALEQQIGTTQVGQEVVLRFASNVGKSSELVDALLAHPADAAANFGAGPGAPAFGSGSKTARGHGVVRAWQRLCGLFRK